MAELRLFNSLTKEKEIFKTKEEGKVKMYVCGITAYDDSHIGHARAYVAFDVLYRYLKHLGYEVVYVRNFTDVDDKIIKKANKNKEDPIELSRRYCEEFEKDMADLQCLTPTNQPRVSEHIEDIKKMISQIIENGCAYTVEGGDVFFSVDSIPTYLVLSGRSPEDNRAGQRVEIDRRKINPADFALWKAAKPGEPSWDSPWGLGRPGWHIECSAMSAKILTHSFDIHGGGMDLIFPHHENEIAQSCAACPESNITYWLHNGVVKKNGEKMGKSAGNLSPIREVTNRYHALPLRHFLMGMHYRADLNYSTSQIEKSSDAVFRIYQTLQRCETLLVEFQKKNVTDYLDVKLSSDAQECVNKLRTEFDMKMSDDLHASAVLTGALADAFTVINACATDLEKNLRKKQLSKQQKMGPVQPLIDLEKEVRLVLGVFGLLSDSSYSEVLGQLKEKALTRAGLTEDEVSRIIEERLVLRKNKDFAGSDKIRLEMKALGIELMDEGEETIWKPYVEKD